MALTLDFINRQQRAVARDNATYQSVPKAADGERRSRNRYTNERGITYIKATQRFRTFAHRPYYFYVGTFQNLEVAVQARNAAEAQALQLLYRAVPDIDPGANNERGVVVNMQKRGSKVIEVYVITPDKSVKALFCDYHDVLEWLPGQLPVRKAAPDGATLPPTNHEDRIFTIPEGKGNAKSE